MGNYYEQLKHNNMFKIKLIIVLLVLLQSPCGFGQSAIGQLETITGQKIKNYKANGPSGYNMNSMVTSMVAQSMINSIFSSNPKTYVAVNEVKVQPTFLTTQISGEKQSIEQALSLEKYERLMKSYKFLKDTAALQYTAFNSKREPTPEEKKATCMNAQKEINQLTAMKKNFEKQLGSFEKLGNNIEDYKKEFEHVSDTAREGMVDNLLDVLPVDMMKVKATDLINTATSFREIAEGAKLFAKVQKLEPALSAAKKMNAATNLLLHNAKEGMTDKSLEQIVLTNDNFTQTGVLVEELKSLGGEKYEPVVEALGKTLQFQGGTLKIYDDLIAGERLSANASIFEGSGGKMLQNIISVAGQFCPLVRITNAGEQLLEKTAYAAIAEYSAHQMATSVSQNEKAKEYSRNKINEINDKLKNYESIVNEYRKINPAGCPVTE